MHTVSCMLPSSRYSCHERHLYQFCAIRDIAGCVVPVVVSSIGNIGSIISYSPPDGSYGYDAATYDQTLGNWPLKDDGTANLHPRDESIVIYNFSFTKYLPRDDKAKISSSIHTVSDKCTKRHVLSSAIALQYPNMAAHS